MTRRAILLAIRAAIPRRFDRRLAGDLIATFELRIRDARGGTPDPLTLRIAGGHCTVSPGPAAHAGATATVGVGDLIRLVSGVVGWPQLLSASRLELSGDPFLALRFPTLFRLPVARRSGGLAGRRRRSR